MIPVMLTHTQRCAALFRGVCANYCVWTCLRLLFPLADPSPFHTHRDRLSADANVLFQHLQARRGDATLMVMHIDSKQHDGRGTTHDISSMGLSGEGTVNASEKNK